MHTHALLWSGALSVCVCEWEGHYLKAPLQIDCYCLFLNAFLLKLISSTHEHVHYYY